MYSKAVVKIPEVSGVSTKTISGHEYVYYQYATHYDRKKHYHVPSRTTIGKVIEDKPGMMHPNPNFSRFFPDEVIPDDTEDTSRSSCLRAGAYIVIDKIIHELGLQGMLKNIIGKQYGLFLDLIAYTIITENNAAQYYPDYAYYHPLFTEGMKVYSDSTVGSFLKDITIDESIDFLNEWNAKQDHRQKIYISYDSTNKKCQAGDIELVEVGHSKSGQPDTIFNMAIAYDRTNRQPLFYEDYPGSIIDVTQLEETVEKAKSFGYKHIGFILDRGYFSEHNILYMEKCGYDFIIMVKGMKTFINEIVEKAKGSFEDKYNCQIEEYGVAGTTVYHRVFKGDESGRCIHIYYNAYKAAAEKDELMKKIGQMKRYLDEHQGKKLKLPAVYDHYFDLVYYHPGKEDEVFQTYVPREQVIERELKLCGYFCIITSEEMDAREALLLYKSRDDSEKLFRGDKSYLGQKAERVYGLESFRAKIFIEFVALIVRSKIYVSLVDEMKAEKKKYNFMTVPAAIHELEKIEMIKYGSGDYRLDHAVTKTQKMILKAFGMNDKDLTDQIKSLSIKLSTLNK